MINIGIVLLITFVIVLILALIGLIIGASVVTYQNKKNKNVVVQQPCNQNINISNLIQIPDGTGTNCTQNGITGSLYYIGDINANYDYVAAPFATQPLDVCVGFCETYDGENCTGPSINGKSSQENFTQCMSQLSSTTCIPPIPIAARGTILYYAFSPTCDVCDNCESTKK